MLSDSIEGRTYTTVILTETQRTIVSMKTYVAFFEARLFGTAGNSDMKKRIFNIERMLVKR